MKGRASLAMVIRTARALIRRGKCGQAEFWVSRSFARRASYKRLRSALDRCWMADLARCTRTIEAR